MGCLFVALAGLLALAMPAAVARASLGGAYLLIAVFTALAVLAVRWRAGRRVMSELEPESAVVADVLARPTVAMTRIGVVAAVYVVVVTIIHLTG